MLIIEFRVENHRSLREEQALSLLAESRIEPGDPTLRQTSKPKLAVLPAIAIYGANASGKSNVLGALTFMRDAVLHSHRFWNPEGGVPRSPFAWNDQSALPSLFEVTFEEGQTQYNYGFTVSDSGVEEEWLHTDSISKKDLVFQRDKSKYKYGKMYQGPKQEIESLTRENALFLSTAVQLGNENLKTIFRFFSAMIPFGKLTRSRAYASAGGFRSMGLEWLLPGLFPSLGMEQFSLSSYEDGVINKVRDLFRAADFGIVDIRKEVSERKLPNGRTVKEEQYLLQHEEGNDDAWLPLEDESDGTQMLFRIAPQLIHLLAVGGVLLIDELETSLHPRLAARIVEMFNCPNINRMNAQLVFTTHDTNLLGNTTGAPALRRDQVWFTEKDNTGSTQLYPLTNFNPRKAENLERGYLQGRYGAVPYLGNLFAGETADTETGGKQ